MIVGGGCRGRQLAAAMASADLPVRVSTRTESGRPAIEEAGAECWIGTPDRLATLRGALAHVTILCWLLGSTVGSPQQLLELHTSRLELFLTQAVDTTVRGIVYEASGTTTPPQLLREGAAIARAAAERNAIPARFLTADPNDLVAWLAEARAGVESLL
jgi:hypothetical protein